MIEKRDSKMTSGLYFTGMISSSRYDSFVQVSFSRGWNSLFDCLATRVRALDVLLLGQASIKEISHTLETNDQRDHSVPHSVDLCARIFQWSRRWPTFFLPPIEQNGSKRISIDHLSVGRVRSTKTSQSTGVLRWLFRIVSIRCRIGVHSTVNRWNGHSRGLRPICFGTDTSLSIQQDGSIVYLSFQRCVLKWIKCVHFYSAHPFLFNESDSVNVVLIIWNICFFSGSSSVLAAARFRGNRISETKQARKRDRHSGSSPYYCSADDGFVSW